MSHLHIGTMRVSRWALYLSLIAGMLTLFLWNA